MSQFYRTHKLFEDRIFNFQNNLSHFPLKNYEIRKASLLSGYYLFLLSGCKGIKKKGIKIKKEWDLSGVPIFPILVVFYEIRQFFIFSTSSPNSFLPR